MPHDNVAQENRMSRRQYLAALGMGSMVGVAGCTGGIGGSSTGGSNNSSGSGGTTTITYRDRDQPFSAYAEPFNNNHEKVKINPSMKAPETKYRGLISQINAGNAPGVVGLDVIYLPRFTQLGALADLGDFYKSLPYTDDFFKPLRRDFIRWNDTVHGLPFWIDSSVYLYNKKHFEDAGLDPENPPQTFNAFLEACQSLKQAGHTPLANRLSQVGLEVFFFMPHVWAGGGKLFNENMTKSLIDQPPAVDALEFFVKLQNEGYTDDQTKPDQYTHAPFISENTSMAYSGAGIGGIRKENEDLFNNMGISMFPKPEGGQQSSFLGGNSITIPTQITQNKDKYNAAKTFAKWVNTEQGMKTTVKETGYLPARKSGFQIDYIQDNIDLYEPFRNALNKGHAPPMHPKLIQMQTPLNNAITRALLGKQEPKAALSEAAEQITQLL